MFDKTVFFDCVRASLFGGGMSQQQVDGMNAILNTWELLPLHYKDIELDMRWLGYMLATTYHETAQKMWPIEEYGRGQGQPYGVPDPQTGQVYFGRGFVQLTWRDNYAKADVELGLTGDQSCEWHAENALDPVIATKIMFIGMYQGWFRGDKLPDYFNDDVDDPVEAREIINGDTAKNGEMIAGYHDQFLDCLRAAWTDNAPGPRVAISSLTLPVGTPFELWVNTSQIAKGVAE